MAQVSARTAVVRVLCCAFLPAAAVLAAVALLGASRGIRLDVLTRDPLAVAGRPAYVGVLSNLGVLLWCAAASGCFLTRAAVGRSRLGTFLLCSGGLTALLLLDDLFMLHEDVLPHALGIGERRVLAAYAALAAAYLATFARVILTTRWHSLPLTAACFALSVAVDANLLFGGAIFVEDAAKFLGIAGWCAYLCSTCAAALAAPLRAAQLRQKIDLALDDELARLERETAARVAELAELARSATGRGAAEAFVEHAAQPKPQLEPRR